MAVEFTEDFVKDNGFTPEQVTALTGYVEPKIAELKQGWDGKANENAQGILTGVVGSLSEKTGFQLEMKQGEKHADFLNRYGEAYINSKLETKSQELTRLETEYKQKLESFNGDAGTKEALQKAKEDLDAALQKYANYDELSDKATKYETLAESNSALKKQVSFGSVKPNFPDTVDPRIIRVEWSEFIDSVEKDWTVEFDTEKNEAVAIDKNNPHNIVKLSSLVDKSEAITTLLAGRQQQGIGAREVGAVEVEGVPFKVNLKSEMSDIHKQIGEHLSSKGLNVMGSEYAQEYAKILENIRKQRTAA